MIHPVSSTSSVKILIFTDLGPRLYESSIYLATAWRCPTESSM
jgi:hypothetical protein